MTASESARVVERWRRERERRLKELLLGLKLLGDLPRCPEVQEVWACTRAQMLQERAQVEEDVGGADRALDALTRDPIQGGAP